MQPETSHAGRSVKSLRFLEQPPPMPTCRPTLQYLKQPSKIWSRVPTTDSGVGSEGWRMVSRRVPSAHRCCLTSISTIFRNIYMKYGYADYLAILLRRPYGKEMEDSLNKDMTILVDCLWKWSIQLSIGKAVSAANHLNNREAKRELDVFVDNKRLVFQQLSSKVPWRAARPDVEIQAIPLRSGRKGHI